MLLFCNTKGLELDLTNAQSVEIDYNEHGTKIPLRVSPLYHILEPLLLIRRGNNPNNHTSSGFTMETKVLQDSLI